MGVTEMLFVVVLDDDVAEVDPDPQSDPAVLGRAASRSIIARCTSAPQRTALTTLENSASIPSPVVLTMRPECSSIFTSTSSRRCALRRSCVPSIGAHQAQVVRHIGGENRGETAGCGFCAPGAIMFSNEFTLKSS